MTREEAIHKLEYSKKAYQTLIDEKVDSGKLVGDGVRGEWKAETSLNEVYKSMIEALDMAIEALKRTRWLSVSERLPKKTGWYLITVKGYKGKDGVCEMCYRKPENYWTGSDITRKILDSNEVTAWMPLPEPYKAESKE